MKHRGGDLEQSSSNEVEQQNEVWTRHVLTGHNYRTWAVKLAADGLTLASENIGRTLRIWNYSSRTGWTQYEPYFTHAVDISKIAMGSSGKVIASLCRDNSLRVWILCNNNWETVMQNNLPYRFSFTSLTISEDCTRLVIADPVKVWGWNGSAWVPEQITSEEINLVEVSVGMCKDGSRIAVVDTNPGDQDGDVHMWERDASSSTWSYNAKVKHGSSSAWQHAIIECGDQRGQEADSVLGFKWDSSGERLE